MNNLRIGTRLWLGFGTIVVLIVGIALVAYYEMNQMKIQTDTLANNNFVKALLASESQEAMQKAYQSTVNAVFADDPASSKKEKENADKHRATYRDAFKRLEDQEQNAEGKAILEKIKALTTKAATANVKALTLAAEGKSEQAAKVINGESHAAMTALLDSFDELTQYQKKRVTLRYEEATSSYQSAIRILAIGSVIAIAIAIVFSILITHSIVTPLSTVIATMRNIAEGERDLTQNMNLTSKDELGELGKWFDMFMDNIQEDIHQIGKSTHQIASAAVQLHTTAEQIAAGAEQVSDQASHVAAAGEQMSASSGDIAQNCALAAESATQASEAAKAGAQIVDETIAVMNSIALRVKETAKTVESLGSRSEQIGEIAGTIQDIADQTNLLALNAAIEAARAGEQGRGFAVVADEVRKLAERTRKATAEISEMIESIQAETKGAVAAMETGVQEVESGSEKASESGKALENILGQISQVSQQINQVAAAAEEQTAATEEISQNMCQITEVVSRTSQGAQETTTASDQLSALASNLDRIVGQFKV